MSTIEEDLPCIAKMFKEAIEQNETKWSQIESDSNRFTEELRGDKYKMIELTSLVKECVSAVTKTADNIYVYINQYEVWIEIDNAAMALIRLSYNEAPLNHMLAFKYDPKEVVEDDINKFFDINLARRIDDKSSQFKFLDVAYGYNMVAKVENLRDDPAYEELLAKKATDGAGFYAIPGNNLYTNYLIPVFTGFPNVSKGDTVGITVYKSMSPMDNVLIMQYDIHRKKIGRDVTIYFRTVDINRPLYDYMY